MVAIKRRKVGKKNYYYLEHSYKHKGKVLTMSKYLGQDKPYDTRAINKLKKEMEFHALMMKLEKQLLDIKKYYANELKRMPAIAKQKMIDSFMVDFIYNSDRIEGSKLSYKDTANLLVHGTTPKNKPLKDVKEAEGYKKAFYDMLEYKGTITLKKICEWHKMIFENSYPVIAGNIRDHKIMVTGTRVAFPPPEELSKMLNDFFSWHTKSSGKYNPVVFSALVHLKFVTIHPFTDGNGRISRLLANYVLHNYNYPMSNILYGDRTAYYASLEKSQLWDEEKHFVRYFIKRYIKANGDYLGRK